MSSLVQRYLEDVHTELLQERSGAVASYIPELARVDPDGFAICLATSDGHVYEVGDSRREFAIQSISKPFTYALALADRGIAAVGEKVDVEPSGEAFNEISLDPTTERPRNPMINAGAIASASLIDGSDAAEKFERVRRLYSRCAGRDLTVDEAMFASESETGHRNRAIGHLLRGYGIIEGDPQEAVELYFRQCSIEVNCRDLALMAATLADNGAHPLTGERVLDPALCERVLSVMTTCGMYNGAGDWVARVGLPAKSGVGGGILAVLPGQFGLAVYSPRLDQHGNSVRGVAACRRLSQDLELHFLHVTRAARSAIRNNYDIVDRPSRHRRTPAEQRALLTFGRRARVFELHGDLLFAGVESVIREITAELDELDVIVLDLRNVAETAEVTRRLMAAARDQLLERGIEPVIVDPDAVLLDADPGRLVRHFRDVDSAVEYAEDRLIERHAPADDAPDAIDTGEHPLLADLPAADLDALMPWLQIRQWAAGDAVVRAGQPPHGLFLVTAGLIELTVDRRGVRHHLSVFTPGTTFGVVYAIAGRDYDLDATARTDTVAAVLPQQALTELGVSRPGVLLTLLRRLVVGSMDQLDWVTRSLVTPSR
ncbi:glutaminase A [Nakamurella flava]|uniref:Glutaminase n=1 Tax=Nakamurella flava TaxID=2576308 RepID=A0A4U6Q968_9ACTN|nr:glutaminase A [Nakamurella flava]TKV56419.1 glutaminase A [Nakamurella flava]